MQEMCHDLLHDHDQKMGIMTVHWRAKFEKRIGCRGRDTNRLAPPAQNRTCAFTHTASTLDKWRQSVP